MHRSRRGLQRGLVSLALALVAAAVVVSMSVAKSAATPAKPKQLTIRIWGDPWPKSFMAACGNKFQRDTGIRLKWDTTDEGPSYTKIVQAIRSGNRPPVDASLQVPTRAYLAAVQKLSIPIDPKIVTNLSKISAGSAKPPGLPSGKGWAYVNYGSSMIVVNYRTDRVKTSEIQSWKDLFNPKWKGSIEWDGQYAGTAFSLAKAFGIDPAKNPPNSMNPVWDKIRELRPNFAILGTDTDSVRALISGEVTMSVHPMSSGVAAKAAGAPVDMWVPKEGAILLGDAYFIPKNIPAGSAHWAQVFINYCLTPAAQSVIASRLGFIPVNPKAKLPAFMKANPRVFPVTAKQVKASAIIAPIPLMARYQDVWQAAFERAAKG